MDHTLANDKNNNLLLAVNTEHNDGRSFVLLEFQKFKGDNLWVGSAPQPHLGLSLWTRNYFLFFFSNSQRCVDDCAIGFILEMYINQNRTLQGVAVCTIF